MVEIKNTLPNSAALDAILKASTKAKYDYKSLARVAFLATNSSGSLYYAGYAGSAQIPNLPGQEDFDGAAKEETPLTKDSIFTLFSATKVITCTAALQLLEQGKFTLETNAEDVLPKFKELKILKDFKNGEPVWEELERKVTVLDLFRHTSGLGYPDDTSEVFGGYMKSQKIPHQWTTLSKSVTEIPLTVQPGSKFIYGMSHDWLGILVETVSGLTLDAYMQKNIFKPLGISNLSFYRTEADSLLEPTIVERNTVKPTAEHPEIGYKPRQRLNPLKPDMHMGGAGLYGPPSGYLRFLRCLLAGGTLDGATILKASTADLLFTPALESNQLASVQEFSGTDADPCCRGESSGRDSKTAPVIERNFTHGAAYIGGDLASGRKKGSITWAGLPSNFWVIDRASDIAFLCWGNVLPYADPELMDVWEKAETELYKGLP